MIGYQELTDEQWSRLKSLLPYGFTGQRGRNANNCRFINALIWLACSGGRWRDLPVRYGSYAAVKVRYYQWVAKGIFQTLLEKVAAEPDMEWLMIDATHIRAHAQAAGARHKKGELKPALLVVQKVD